MRFLLGLFAAIGVLSCATDTRIVAVPETGAFDLHYVELDGDLFLSVEKDSVPHIIQLTKADHPNRQGWKRQDWLWYTSELFPQDEINFDRLRMLRGTDMVPVGLTSPTPMTPVDCRKSDKTALAKYQKRLVVPVNGVDATDGLDLITECDVHTGLSLSQMQSVHQRPNPERFPTRYETLIDLDADGKREQWNVRLRNVSKADVLTFAGEETGLTRNQLRQLQYTVDRM